MDEYQVFHQKAGFHSYIEDETKKKLFILVHLSPNWKDIYEELHQHKIRESYVTGIQDFVKSSNLNNAMLKIFSIIDEKIPQDKVVKFKYIKNLKKNNSVWNVLKVAFNIKDSIGDDEVVTKNCKDFLKLSLICTNVQEIEPLLSKISIPLNYSLKSALINLQKKRDFLVFTDEHVKNMLKLIY